MAHTKDEMSAVARAAETARDYVEHAGEQFRESCSQVGRVAEGPMSFRLRLTSVSGFPRSWLNIRWPCDTDRLRPRQTGRADFPHPAFPDPLRAYPVTFPCNSRYLNGTGFFERSGFKSLSIR